MIDPATSAAVSRLPVLSIVKRTYAEAWKMRGKLFGAVIAFDVVLLAIAIIMAVIAGAPDSTGQPLAAALSVGIMLLALAFSVGLYRVVLNDEQRGWFRLFCFGWPLWRTVKRSVAVFIGASVVLVILIGLSVAIVRLNADTRTGQAASRAAIGLIWVALGGAGLWCTGRWWLALVAPAVDDVHIGFKETWRRSAGNAWRILGAIMLASAPFLLADLAMQLVEPNVEIGSLAVLFVVALVYGFVIVPLQLIVTTTVQALCYDCVIRATIAP